MVPGRALDPYNLSRRLLAEPKEQVGELVFAREQGNHATQAPEEAEPPPGNLAAEIEAAPDEQAAPRRQLLGDLLVHRHMITPVQLAEALLQQQARSGKRLGQLLVEIGALDERDLAKVLSEQMEIGLADLGAEKPTPQALEKVPEAVARTSAVIPLRIADGRLLVAVADPADTELVDHLERVAEMPVTLLIAPARDIGAMIDRSYKVLTGLERHVEAFQFTEAQRRIDQPLQQAVNENAPVVQIVKLVIAQAIRDRASDIHIETQEDRVRVRFRIDGALHDMVGMPSNMAPAMISRVKVMAGMNIVERQRSQDGQFALSLDGRDVNFRVATTATIWGEKAVIRILDKGRSIYRLDELGMPVEIRGRYSKLIRSPTGMVLVAGPTGSGKTTTLYATMLEINDPQRNIMTIEDPVEYIFPSINQIQIKEAAGITFASGLRSILRQDPDILLVGEIRDVETAKIAANSALTGHLVLSSIHATDSITALQRFIDMGIEPFVVSSSMLAVVSQRLIRRICTNCKERYRPGSEEVYFYVDTGGGGTQFWHGRGCNFCSGTGYQDRIGVFEMLVVDEVVKQMIVRSAPYSELLGHATAVGMRPLRQQAIQLVDEGITTPAEVLRAMYTA